MKETEFIIFNNQRNQFKFYKGDETIDEIRTGNKIVKPFITADTLHPIISHKIGRLAYKIILNDFIKFPYKEEFGPYVFVSRVVKSKSKKSVHQYYSHNNYHEVYNLPEHFREMQFSAILSRTAGPFSKQKSEGELVEVEPWYCNQVFFAGNTTECLEQIVYRLEIKDFFINNASDLFQSAENKYQLSFIEKCLLDAIDNNTLKSILYNVIGEYRKYFEEQQSLEGP
jgi:hypothetical protein